MAETGRRCRGRRCAVAPATSGSWTGTRTLIWGGNSVRPDPSTGNPTALVDGAAYIPYPL